MSDSKSRHDHATLNFPKGFLWGAGSSAFQVEGNLVNSDWWEWEQDHLPKEFRSGVATDHYNRYKEDFELAKKLGHNSTRVSLDWSRIEPREGEFDTAEIEHYKEVLKFIKDQGMEVMLTIHHFANPAWFAKKGGWTSLSSPHYFEQFVKRIVPEFNDAVDLWITINEPSVYTSLAYLSAEFPPQKKNPWLAFLALVNMARAHKKAYKIIHQFDKNAKAAISNPVQSFDTIHFHSFREHLAEILADFFANHLFYFLTGMGNQDFIGLNYYQNWYIGRDPGQIMPQAVNVSAVHHEVTDLGWEIHPEGMFEVIMDFKDYKKPIYITENGLATINDDRRVRYLLSYLTQIYHAIALGADVRGYTYWSLTDNMELHRGYEPKFGLIEVDFKTLKRTPKPSSYVYKEIIKHNGISHHLLKLLGHGIQVEEVIKIDADL